MPTSTVPIMLGVPGSRSNPVSRAAPTTVPTAVPPTTDTASSGTNAASTLRNTNTLIRTINPTTSRPTTVCVVSSASARSTTSARPPVNPVRKPASPNSCSARSWKTRYRECMLGSVELPRSRASSSANDRSGAFVMKATRGAWE